MQGRPTGRRCAVRDGAVRGTSDAFPAPDSSRPAEGQRENRRPVVVGASGKASLRAHGVFELEGRAQHPGQRAGEGGAARLSLQPECRERGSPRPPPGASPARGRSVRVRSLQRWREPLGFVEDAGVYPRAVLGRGEAGSVVTRRGDGRAPWARCAGPGAKPARGHSGGLQPAWRRGGVAAWRQPWGWGGLFGFETS